MAVQGHFETYVITAQESLSDATAGTGHLYKAVDISSAKIANTASVKNPIGILQSLRNINESVDVAIYGVSKFVAGASITPGQELRVTTSGYLIPVTSGFPIVAVCARSSVGSGAVGHCLFFGYHPAPSDQWSSYISKYEETTFTPGDAMTGVEGRFINVLSLMISAGAYASSAVLITGTASGVAGAYYRADGIVPVTVGCGGSVAGRAMRSAISGYATLAVSGDLISGRFLTGVTSGLQANATLGLANPSKSVSSVDLNL